MNAFVTTDQTKNLKQLLRVAKKFRREGTRIDMGSWGDTGNRRTAPKRSRILKGDCGTTVCLAGRCGLNPYFQDRGLVTQFTQGETFDENGRLALYVDHSFQGMSEYQLQQLFGLSHDATRQIFFGYNETTPKGRISKKRTLDRIVGAIKTAALAEHGVTL